MRLDHGAGYGYERSLILMLALSASGFPLWFHLKSKKWDHGLCGCLSRDLALLASTSRDITRRSQWSLGRLAGQKNERKGLAARISPRLTPFGQESRRIRAMRRLVCAPRHQKENSSGHPQTLTACTCPRGQTGATWTGRSCERHSLNSRRPCGSGNRVV